MPLHDSFIEVRSLVASDPGFAADFRSDPNAALQRRGFADVSAREAPDVSAHGADCSCMYVDAGGAWVQLLDPACREHGRQS
jgi:hypothetical protein